MKRNRGSQQQPSIRNFFTAKAGTSEPLGQAGNVEPPSKKPKQSNDAECIIVLDDDEQGDSPAAAAAPASGTARHCQASANAHVERRAAVPTQRDAAAHGMAQAKLVSTRSASRDLDAAAEPQQQQQLPARGTRRQAPAPKYTPLEQQVVALKAAHPGVLLLIEVGYKMRMFGQDAGVAAKELGIACYFDHNFMTASFPVPRLSIHVRRLVAAGHKVGVVRQTESAALKAAGDNKSAPFTRSLTGLFTAATLEAAEKADKLDEATYMEVSQELEAMLGGSARSPAANYILIVAQDMPVAAQQQQAPQSVSSAASKVAAAAAAGGASGLLGLLAVDAGSGDIAYGLGSVEVSSAAAGASSADPNSTSSGGGSGGVSHRTEVMPLEAVLLSLTPSDIVLCEPVAAATEQMLKNYMAGASRRCRRERLQPQQWKQRQGQSNSKGYSSSAQRAGSYLDAGLMNDLVDFFSEDSPAVGAAAAAGPSRNPASTESPGAASVAAGVDAGSKQDASAADSLQFILSLPQPVLAAVAGGLAYLKPFGLSELLRCTSSYRGLTVGGSMTLDGSALRQLEVLESGAESAPQLKGSLLHVLDRCSTAAGGRMLRRWLAAPLADRSTIVDRQQAVQVLLDSITGSNSDQQPQQQGGASALSVLQHLPKWLCSTRQDLERALARVAAGTAAPAEAVGLWSRLAQLPSALHLPMKQQQAANSSAHADADAGSGAAESAPSSQLDLDSLSGAVSSRLLVSLLAAAAGPDVAGPAAEVLGSLDAAAAAKNDFLALFKSQKHFPEVFACKAAVSGAEAHLQDLLPKLAAAAGVRSLSYVSIQNQGNYLLELPAARTDVPQGWDKVCATKKVCRYHPTEVKQGMAALARAQEQLQAACAAAWTQLLKDFTAAHHAAFRAAVAAVAQLDALHGLAVVASSPGYCRPQFVEEGEPQQLCITDGKHPMLDLALDGAAVPNSLDLRWDGTRAAVITGPNMGGKSVLMRQAALIVIMAQLGSWVPASSCVLSVFDGVYCRMGASDCLMLGRSTFAEELGEASHILAAATNRSLVIMDELGRGTATHDGVAIACATLEHLVSHTRCLSLFVTHYPEVASLASSKQQCAAEQPATEPPAPAQAPADGVGAAGGAAPGGSSGEAGSSSSGSAGEAQATKDALSSHIAVYHMSYVRQDTMPQQAAAEAAATGTSNASAPQPVSSMAAGTAAPHDVGAEAAVSEAIPVITFLYKLAEGAADESFGLNVAQMAGLPSSVVQRAAVVARLLKARLGMQQQQQEQEQPSAKHWLPAQQQQDSKQNIDSSQLVQLMQRVCQALRAAQQGDEACLGDLLQLQASASKLITEPTRP